MPELVLKLGDNEIGRYVFEKDIMSIGRAKDNDVVVENLSVSRNHARIRFHNGKYVLTDLNSANGTFINGERQTKIELTNGDTIQIGKHTLVFMNQKLTEEQLIAEQLGQDRTVMVNAVMKPMLQVTSGKLTGTQYVITKFETKIGKGSDCDLILTDDWLMPNVLALILRRGDEVYEIHDRGKLVRTKVNGENVDQPRILKYGDRVEFGSTGCVFDRAPESLVGGTGASSGARPKVDLGNYDSVFSKSGSESSVMEAAPSNAAEPIRSPKSSGTFAPASNRVPTQLPEEEVHSLDLVELEPMVKEVTAIAADPAAEEVAEVEPEVSPQVEAVPVPQVPQGMSPVMAAMAAAGGDAQRSPAPDGGSSTAQLSAAGSSSMNLASAGAWRSKEFPPLPEGVDPKEVAMWEAMLDNKSAVVRKQAVRQLKKLTDRDYDI